MGGWLGRVRESLGRVPRNIKVLALGWLVWSPVQAMAGPYTQLYVSRLGASPEDISLVQSATQVANALSRIVGGFLSDRYGRKRVLWVGTFLVALAYLLMSVATDWRSYAIASVLNGFALFYQPALEGIQADSVPLHLRGRMNAFLNLVPGLASSLSPLGGAALVNTYGLVGGVRVIFFLSFATGVAIAIARLLWIEETLEPRGSGVNMLESYVDALRHVSRDVYTLITLDTLFNLVGAMSFLSNYYMYYYLGVDKSELAMLASLGSLVNLGLLIPAGRAVDTRGRNFSITLGFLMGTLSQLFFVLSPPSSSFTLPALIVSTLFGAVGGAFYGLAYSSLRADLVPKEYRGRIYALWGLAPAASWSLGAYIGGWMYSNLGPQTPFVASFMLRVLLTPLALTLFGKLTRKVDLALRNVEGS